MCICVRVCANLCRRVYVCVFERDCMCVPVRANVNEFMCVSVFVCWCNLALAEQDRGHV